MQVKLVRKNYLFEYHTTALPSCQYDKVHVTSRNNQLIVFAGSLQTDSQSIECVMHGELTDYDILCLQIILSYGCKVSKVHYRFAFQLLLQHYQCAKLKDFAALIHADPEWVKKMLMLKPEINTDAMPLMNAYYLNKLKNPSETIRNQAKLIVPIEYGPLVLSVLKDERTKK